MFADTLKSNPSIGLAPMAGITDLSFRELCEGFGADYSVTEMASSLPRLMDSRKNQKRLHFTDSGKPKIIQIIGNNAREMAEAAAFYEGSLGAEMIDINMGCPAKKVSSKGAGSALLGDLPLVERILQAVTRAVKVPVTLKTRLGLCYRQLTLFDVAKHCEAAGIARLTIHGRTRACRFNGMADYDLIAQLKQQTHLPIIANGDIDSFAKAQFVLQHTRCDGLLIGRASLGQPWLFRALRGEALPDLAERKKTAQVHLQMIQERDPVHGVKNARKHLRRYLHHLCPEADVVRVQALLVCEDVHQQSELFTALLE